MPAPGCGLQVCPLCRADVVYAEDRDRCDDERWWMQLRCGQCQGMREVVLPSDLAQRFDADAARARGAIAGALATLELERMAVQADVFALALEHDLIDARDFGSHRRR
jgi:hypothetical protein